MIASDFLKFYQKNIWICSIKVRLDWSNAKRRLATFANLCEWSLTSLAIGSFIGYFNNLLLKCIQWAESIVYFIIEELL